MEPELVGRERQQPINVLSEKGYVVHVDFITQLTITEKQKLASPHGTNAKIVCMNNVGKPEEILHRKHS